MYDCMISYDLWSGRKVQGRFTFVSKILVFTLDKTISLLAASMQEFVFGP